MVEIVVRIIYEVMNYYELKPIVETSTTVALVEDAMSTSRNVGTPSIERGPHGVVKSWSLNCKFRC